jgi:hypothetical protein
MLSKIGLEQCTTLTAWCLFTVYLSLQVSGLQDFGMPITGTVLLAVWI